MYLSTEDCLAAIEQHTRGLAQAAQGHLDARIEHCPEWSMADLVWHLTGVHRFWEYVARERPTEPPELPELDRPEDSELVEGMLAGMDKLVATLRAADQDAPCWTWGLEQNVRFIARHQVQEAAVHHWDAVNAGAGSWTMDSVAAIDAVEEFLTHSVGNERWPKEGAEPIGGTLWFCPCIAHDVELCPLLYVTDGDRPGTVSYAVDPEDDPEGLVHGHHVDPRDLLLWLYGRLPDERLFVDYETDAEVQAMIDRFKAMTYTD